MATIKKGTLTRAGQCWKHLRPFGKRQFWKRERTAAKCHEEIRAANLVTERKDQ